jgi:hypothetical protein
MKTAISTFFIGKVSILLVLARCAAIGIKKGSASAKRCDDESEARESFECRSQGILITTTTIAGAFFGVNFYCYRRNFNYVQEAEREIYLGSEHRGKQIRFR